MQFGFSFFPGDESVRIQTRNLSDSAALQDLVISTRESGLTKIEQKLNRSWTATEEN